MKVYIKLRLFRKNFDAFFARVEISLNKSLPVADVGTGGLIGFAVGFVAVSVKRNSHMLEQTNWKKKK